MLQTDCVGRELSEEQLNENNPKKRKFESSLPQHESAIENRDELRNELISKHPPLLVLYRDADVLVIDKPSNLRIYASQHYSQATVELLVKHQFPELFTQNKSLSTSENKKRKFNKSDERKIRFAHRLDMATSGILCMCLTKQSCASLSNSFEQKNSQKYYLAMVWGHITKDDLINNLKMDHINPETECFAIQSFIGRDDSSNADGTDEDYDPTGRGYLMKQVLNLSEVTFNSNLHYATKEERQQHNFREASTECRLLSYGTFQGREVSKILLKPLTGRKHQLRLHMKLIGHSIVGDQSYSNNDVNPDRMMLHAFHLVIPITKEYLSNSRSTDISTSHEPRILSIQTKDPFQPLMMETKVFAQPSTIFGN